MKRTLSMILCLVMILGILPVMAFAAPTYITETTVKLNLATVPYYSATAETPAQLKSKLTVTGANSSMVEVTSAAWYDENGNEMAGNSFNVQKDYYILIRITAKSGYQFYHHNTIGLQATANTGIQGQTWKSFKADLLTSHGGAYDDYLDYKLWFHSCAKIGSYNEAWNDDSVNVTPHLVAPQLYEGTEAQTVRFTKYDTSAPHTNYGVVNIYGNGYFQVFNGSTALNPTDKLQAGVKYTVRMMLTVLNPDYYIFSANPVPIIDAPNGTNYGTGAGAAKIYQHKGSQIIIEYTYTVPCMKNIQSLSVGGVIQPDKGMNPQQTGFTCPDNNIQIKTHAWIDNSADKLMSATDTFKGGRSYTLVLEASSTSPSYEFNVEDPAAITTNLGTVTKVSKYFQFHPSSEMDYDYTHGTYIWIDLTSTGDPMGADLGTVTFDLSAGPTKFEFPEDGDAALLWVAAVLSGKVSVPTTNNIDLDKDGTVDFVQYTEADTLYIKVADTSSISGKYVLDLSENAAGDWNAGNDCYSSFTFIFPVRDGNYGTKLLDFTKTWNVYSRGDDDPVATYTALDNTLGVLTSAGVITMRRTTAGKNWFEYYDLDNDGNEDVFRRGGTFLEYWQPLCRYQQSSYDFTLTAPQIIRLRASGKTYFTTLSFRFPDNDAGEFIVNLSAGPMTYVANSIVEHRTMNDTITALQWFNLVGISDGSTEGTIDVNLDGTNDISYTRTSNTDNTWTWKFTPLTDLEGDYAFTFTDEQIAEMAYEEYTPLYTTVTFRFPAPPAATVHFEMNGHGSPIADQTVPYGSKAYEPNYPQGGEFWFYGGWYTDAALKQRYDFNQPVTKDTTLYCRWVNLVDVPNGKWFTDKVAWAVYKEITAGTDATHFSPNATCTREQIVTFLYAAAGKPAYTDNGSPFTDVKKGKYYYDAVMWAVENNITGGMGDGKFGVGLPCTREQVVTFLWKASGSPKPATTTNPFKDVKSDKYYFNAILWAVENGITSGMGDGTFGVGQTCTRAQIVTFLYAAYGPKG